MNERIAIQTDVQQFLSSALPQQPDQLPLYNPILAMKTTFRYLFVHASFLAHVTVIVTKTVHQQTLGPALYQQQLLATATAIGVVVSQREPFLSRMAEVGRTSLMTHEVQDPEGGHPHQEGEEVVDEGVEVVVEGVMGEGGHHLGVVKQ